MTVVDLRTQRSTLLASSLAVVVVMLNVAAVNPTLHSLQRAFQTTSTDLQWVVNVYNIIYAALLLVGGLLGSRLGFRRVLLAGLWRAWPSGRWEQFSPHWRPRLASCCWAGAWLG